MENENEADDGADPGDFDLQYVGQRDLRLEKILDTKQNQIDILKKKIQKASQNYELVENDFQKQHDFHFEFDSTGSPN